MFDIEAEKEEIHRVEHFKVYQGKEKMFKLTVVPSIAKSEFTRTTTFSLVSNN